MAIVAQRPLSDSQTPPLSFALCAAFRRSNSRSRSRSRRQLLSPAALATRPDQRQRLTPSARLLSLSFLSPSLPLFLSLSEMARPGSAADEAYAALAADFVAAVVAGASARMGTPLRPDTGLSTASSSLQHHGRGEEADEAGELAPEAGREGGSAAVSRPDTGLLREETALAVESALDGAFASLREYGLISDGKPMEQDKAMALLAGLIEVMLLRTRLQRKRGRGRRLRRAPSGGRQAARARPPHRGSEPGIAPRPNRSRHRRPCRLRCSRHFRASLRRGLAAAAVHD